MGASLSTIHEIEGFYQEYRKDTMERIKKTNDLIKNELCI